MSIVATPWKYHVKVSPCASLPDPHSVTSHWKLDISLHGSMYMTKNGKSYK